MNCVDCGKKVKDGECKPCNLTYGDDTELHTEFVKMFGSMFAVVLFLLILALTFGGK